MRFLQRQIIDAGLGGGHSEVRVVNVEPGEETPPNVVRVADDAPVTDWVREDAATAPVVQIPPAPAHEVVAGDGGGGTEG